jgi:hypothetical protein
VPVVPVFFSGSSPICGHGRALRAATRLVILRERGWPALLETARLVILREVAGSTLAHGVTAGVDSATARGMTPLDARPHEDAPGGVLNLARQTIADGHHAHRARFKT